MSAFGPSCRPSDILSVIDAVDGSSTRHVSAMDMGAVEALKGRVSATRLLQCVRQVLALSCRAGRRHPRQLSGGGFNRSTQHCSPSDFSIESQDLRCRSRSSNAREAPAIHWPLFQRS
jgi:hypothetical protein